MKRAVVAIYVDADFYPPTINAILNLSERVEEVFVISRNNSIRDYPYPSNVHLKKTGKYISVRDSEKLPVWLKIKCFLKFTFSFFKYAGNKNTDLVLVYDPFALLAFYLVRFIRHGRKIWYHNHDMPDKSMVRKYSIGSFAARYESKAMRHIDFFSLPSRERLPYYKDTDAAIPVFILPNYPSLKVYGNLQKKKSLDKKITVIYQGFIGKGHSLEKFVELLQEKIMGFELNLILKGSVTPAYKSSLDELAKAFNTTGKLTWLEVGPYYELPALTAACDIGIGINMNTDIVSQTQGTASNKIYEYAASELPVIVYNTPQFTKYLQKYNWAFFTDGSVNSIRKNMEEIIKGLPGLGKSARYDFERTLNFENYFVPALKTVMESVKQA